MILITEIKEVIKMGHDKGTRIKFFVSDDSSLEYVDNNIYVGFTYKENNKDKWAVFKVISRTKSTNRTNTTYEAEFLGAYWDEHKVFDKFDIDETDIVNIVDSKIINKAESDARNF